MLNDKLNKFTNTSFILDSINNHLEGNLFIVVKELNLVRRRLIEKIEEYYSNSRILPQIKDDNQISYEVEKEIKLVGFARTEDQARALKDEGIETIYYDNYSPYVNAKYQDIKGLVLAGNYGALHKYKGNPITTDYSFNVANSSSIYYLHKQGALYVTASLELSKNELKEMYNEYLRKYNIDPNLEMIVYGHQMLMTLKYCPLKRYGECGNCDKHDYVLKDDKASFLTSRDNCITKIYNSKALNLIDNLDELSFIKRFRLQFSVESYDETVRIIKMFKEKLNGSTSSYFNKETDTRGYLKDPIL